MATNSYKCTVCKRQIEQVENIYGLDTFAKCIITHGCRGKLRRTGRNPDNIRESFPKFEINLEDYAQRNAFYPHTQLIENTAWIVTHGLNCSPAVSVFVLQEDGSYVQLGSSDFTISSLDRNTSTLTFTSPCKGIAQFTPRSTAVSVVKKVSTDSLTQVTVNGTFVFAVPKLITKLPNGTYPLAPIDLLDPVLPIKIGVSIQRPNDEELTCYEVIEGTLDLTPWSDSDEIVLGKRRSFYLKTKNILNFTSFNNPDLEFTDIPEGTQIRFTYTDFATGYQTPIESKSLLLLLSESPYQFVDRVKNRIVDVGEVCGAGNAFIYSNGELYISSSLVEKTYPPIEAARTIGAVPPLPSPSPTPTVTPTVTITPTITVTPSVTPTQTVSPTVTPTATVTPTITVSATVTPTPTITVTPSVTESVTPTPTPTITVTPTITETVTPTPTITITPTITETATPTPTPTPSGVPTDPLFGSVVLLSSYEGADNSSPAVTDHTGRHTGANIGVAGSGTKIVTTDSDFPSGALNVDGNTNYVNYDTDNLADFNFGTGDFCVELTFKLDAHNAADGSWFFANYQGVGGGVGMYIDGTGANMSMRQGDSTIVSRATSISTGTVYHIAWVRQSGTVRYFLNGVKQGADVTDFNGVTVGATINTLVAGEGAYFNNGGVDGRISWLRVTKGNSRYWADFTPDARPYPTS